MSARSERIAAAIAGVRQRMVDKDTQISALTEARDRLQRFIDTPDWGALDSGESIAEGTVVRFGAVTYRCRTAHSKALTRSPLNLIYWEIAVTTAE